METKKYYCSSNSKSYIINVVFSIVSAFVAALCLIMFISMLISPIVLFWVWDWLNSDLDIYVDPPVLYAIVLFLRFLCHFATGILIWSSYAPEGQPVWLYSLLYNGGYMLFETIISMILIVLIKPRIKINL